MMRTKKIKRIVFIVISIIALSLSCKVFSPIEESPSPTATPRPSATETSLPDIILMDSIGDPFSPELGSSTYDVQNYLIQIRLNPEVIDHIEAVVEIEAFSLINSLSKMSLDFIGFDILDLTVDGIPANFERVGDKLVVDLPKPISKNQNFSVLISYDGEIVRRSSRYIPFEESIGMLFPDSKSLVVASEPDGARFWFPCNDHPRDKAIFRIEVTTPSKYLAASNGRLIETEEIANSQTRFVWEHPFPMATYLATIVVGEYERFEQMTENGILIRDYIFPEIQTSAFEAFSQTTEMLEWLESLLGPYPFDTYGHATVNIPGFSLETQSMVVMSNMMLEEDIVIHEMTHMWFGDWVSLDSWGEMWRNEGFASYFSWYWFYRDDLGAFNRDMASLTQDVLEVENLEALGNLSPANLFSYESYTKGGVLVHALRLEVGEEAFFEGLKLYFNRYGGMTASDEDFQMVMEEASNLNLDEFFEEWLHN
ncbi:MAG: M1 family metallopeptidase [Chloroflexi bacterium]|nr:M1 family metallopeptidase [Chloroflexota bacterium]MBT4756066.1 M1 family metallopeptidase [Chloroflexota bacterium]MBT6988667.1 M1 family metallopeptidase [Chloroflexota bacterium]MBT7217616.1 M1 family metallopeptidase [Chloroflexota bacterium]